MTITQHCCNICRRVIARSDREVFGIALKPAGPTGREFDNLQQVPADDTDIHLCLDCTLGLRAFFDSGLLLNVFGEQTTMPRLPPDGTQVSPLY